MTHSPPELRSLLADHGLSPQRAFGQNFVADPNTVRKIAALAAVGPGDRVVEIGAGLGSLTLALADTGAEVVAVEVDRRVAAVLDTVVAGRNNVQVVVGDALDRGWVDALHTAGAATWVLVANLPYNVATPLVCDVLDEVPEVGRLLVMVQREVAERFAAAPNTPAYGAVSVKTRFWGSARIVGHVPASVFVPRPNVESALLDIRRTGGAVDRHPDVDPPALFSLVRAGFTHRRKMLRSGLRGRIEPEAFDRAGVSPTSRPGELDIDEWIALWRATLGDLPAEDPPEGRAVTSGTTSSPASCAAEATDG